MTGNTSQLTMRPATELDLDEIAVVHCESALAAFADIFPKTAPKPTPASVRPRWQRLVLDPSDTVLVAEKNGVLGCVALRPDSTTPARRLLDGLYVHPRSWGTGVGGALHDAIVHTAISQKAAGMSLWVLEANTLARQMYERRGWQLVPDRFLENEPKTVIDVLYHLEFGDHDHGGDPADTTSA